MKRYQDLTINCSKDEAKLFFERVQKRINVQNLPHWRNDERTTSKANHFGGVARLDACTIYMGENIKAFVFMVYLPHKGCVSVNNITSRQISPMPIDQYNAILDEFHRDVVIPSLDGLVATKTSDTYAWQTLMSDELQPRFEAFARLANKEVLHPLDIERWHRFVIAVFQSGEELGADTIGDILQQEFGWPEDAAWELGARYEDEIELLNAYSNASKLDGFHRDVVVPNLDGLMAHKTGDTHQWQTLMPGELQPRFEAFARLANKDMLHPLDIERWHCFVIAVFQSGEELVTDTIWDILQQEFDWSEDAALELRGRYEDEIELLDAYSHVCKEGRS